jgi:ankyrin repeat protein
MTIRQYIEKNNVLKVSDFLKSNTSNIKYDDFKYACKKNYFEIVKLILNHENFNLSYQDEHIKLSIIRGNIEVIKTLIKHKGKDSYRDLDCDQALYIACSYGKFNIASILLESEKCNPSKNRNNLIKSSYENEYYDIVEILWKDKKVQNTLNNDCPEIYEKLIQKYIQSKIKAF